MASILKVDDLRGNTSAGDITITSEGGSATMQLQQGLAKVWTFDETLATNPDASEGTFNVSSTTDNSLGNLYIDFTNGFSAVDFCSQGTATALNDISTTKGSSTISTTRDHVRNYDTAFKDNAQNYTAFGDLA